MSDVTSHMVWHLANLAIIPILTIYWVQGTIPYRLLSAWNVLSYHLHLYGWLCLIIFLVYEYK
jgi:hypothetical protein